MTLTMLDSVDGMEGTDETDLGQGTRTYHLVLVNAGVSEPSSTDRLGHEVAQAALDAIVSGGHSADFDVIELKDLALDIARAAVSCDFSGTLRSAIGKVAASDALVAATPVFKASYAGLFKTFWDVVDPDALTGKPVALVATSGSLRHALVPDSAMRSLFAFFKAVVIPTSVHASGTDWGSDALGERVAQAGRELAVFTLLDVNTALRHSGASVL